MLAYFAFRGGKFSRCVRNVFSLAIHAHARRFWDVAKRARRWRSSARKAISDDFTQPLERRSGESYWKNHLKIVYFSHARENISHEREWTRREVHQRVKEEGEWKHFNLNQHKISIKYCCIIFISWKDYYEEFSYLLTCMQERCRGSKFIMMMMNWLGTVFNLILPKTKWPQAELCRMWICKYSWGWSEVPLKIFVTVFFKFQIALFSIFLHISSILVSRLDICENLTISPLLQLYSILSRMNLNFCINSIVYILK